MIGVMHDFVNLTLTSFPTAFDPQDLTTSVLLSSLDSVDLIVELFPLLSVI